MGQYVGRMSKYKRKFVVALVLLPSIQGRKLTCTISRIGQAIVVDVEMWMV